MKRSWGLLGLFLLVACEPSHAGEITYGPVTPANGAPLSQAPPSNDPPVPAVLAMAETKRPFTGTGRPPTLDAPKGVMGYAWGYTPPEARAVCLGAGGEWKLDDATVLCVMPDRIVASPIFCNGRVCAVHIMQVVDGEGPTRLEATDRKMYASFGLPSSMEPGKRFWIWPSDDAVMVELGRREGHDVLSVTYSSPANAARMRVNANPLGR